MNFSKIYKYTKYIDDKSIQRNVFNNFMVHFEKLHNRTEYISKNFDKYIDILKVVYDFIFLNLDKISIRVDSYDAFMEKYCTKITKVLNIDTNICTPNNKIPKLSTDMYSFVDFGGGQGIFLNYMCKQLNTHKCSVIEKKNDEFVYSDTIIDANKNINYSYWNDLNFDITDNSIDCCCAIQVLHHLPEELIHVVLSEFHRILLPNGIVFLVEHDVTEDIKSNVDSDHHLYHILNDQIRLIKDKKLINIPECVDNFKTYVDNQFINYKTTDEWTELFAKHKFKIDTISLGKIPYNGKYYSIYRK